jgi:hypothetical protein
MGFTLGYHEESVKRAEKRAYRPLCATKANDPDPSSYFPNSFSRHFGE